MNFLVLGFMICAVGILSFLLDTHFNKKKYDDKIKKAIIEDAKKRYKEWKRREQFKKEIEEQESLEDLRYAEEDSRYRALKKKKLFFKIMAKQPTQ